MIYVLGLSNRGPRGPRIPPWVLEPALLADLNFPIDFLMYIDSLIGLQRRMERYEVPGNLSAAPQVKRLITTEQRAKKHRLLYLDPRGTSEPIASLPLNKRAVFVPRHEMPSPDNQACVLADKTESTVGKLVFTAYERRILTN